VLEGKDLRDKVTSMVEAMIDQAVETYLPERGEPDWEGLAGKLRHKFGPDFDLQGIEEFRGEAVNQELYRRAQKRYDECEEINGAEAMRLIERYLLLETIDNKWKDHLWAMDSLKAGIGLRSYAQVDPKNEFKKEGYRNFEQLKQSVAEEVTDLIFKVRLQQEEDLQPSGMPEGTPVGSPGPGPADAGPYPAGGEDPLPVKESVRRRHRVKRNDPCPCGSGKKYKKCCGRNEK
jgi:preprotein translocase subunit SecA